MKCPHCKSTRVHHSLTGGLRVPWLLRPFIVALRCYSCERQFLARGYLLLGRFYPQAQPRQKPRRAA